MRLAGSLHSFNDLAATDGLQIQTDKLSQVLSIDKQRQIVKVQGGIKLRELLKVLAKEGLTLPNQGYIKEQSIAGAIATATHGSGKTGTLSSFVLELELLDAKGQLHTLNPETNPHLFSAAVVNLGCLGVITSVTLRCIPLQKLQLSKIRSILPDTLKEKDEFRHQNDYFQCMVNPYSDKVVNWCFKRTDSDYQNRGLYFMHWLFIKSLAVGTFDVCPPPNRFLPMLLDFFFWASRFDKVVDDSYVLLSPADEGHYIEEEIAVPYEHLDEALNTTRKIIGRFREQNKCFVVVILLRFAEADSYGYLSPALGKKTAYISLITLARKGFQEFFRAVEQALYAYEGKPHWGKFNSLTGEEIAMLYGERFTRFLEARRELDPKGLFLNNYCEKLGILR